MRLVLLGNELAHDAGEISVGVGLVIEGRIIFRPLIQPNCSEMKQPMRGAIFGSRLGKLVYGASDEKRGVGDLVQRIYSKKMELLGGILEEECKGLLEQFFKERRKNN